MGQRKKDDDSINWATNRLTNLQIRKKYGTPFVEAAIYAGKLFDIYRW